MPPSVLYMVFIVAHIPGRCFDDGWLRGAKDADWMDSLVRTMSRGYVKKTEVIPAVPPQIRRLTEVMSPPGVISKNWRTGLVHVEEYDYGVAGYAILERMDAHLLVEVIAPELHSRIRHDAYAIGPVSPHESPPTLIFPHLGETLSDRELVFFAAHALDLEEDLESF
jgi:hypothetical protein